MLTLPEPLRAMASYAQFIVWEAVWSVEKNKFEKIPLSPHTLQKFPKDGGWQTDPSQWATFDQALQAANVSGNFVGFIFTKNDPFFFVDIDKALQPDGSWSSLATDLCYMFSGCAVEISQSGTGLHIFGVGTAPEDHRCRDDKIGLEFYTSGRFVALTGINAIGDSGTQAQAGVDMMLAKYLPPRAVAGSQDWTTEPDAEWSGPEDDDELIKKMLAAKPSAGAAFGAKAPLPVLWVGDEEQLSKFFPSASGDTFDRSAADSALCQHLAFWTGKDCERMQRLFERSGLVRDKWRDREKYRHDTITQNASWCGSVLKSNKKEKVIDEDAPVVLPDELQEGVIREGYQYLGLPQQIEYFKDCVYVSTIHSIKIPNGDLKKPDEFRATYGGYWFALDSIGDKSTKNAWEVFTESQGLRFPRADMTCFRPEIPPNTIIHEDGRTLVNTYIPIKTPRIKGDATPFLTHVAKLIPNAQDREYLISYMAACLQMVGVKFRWCPFIQGVPGNGKSELSKIMARAVGRRYTHSPTSKDMANAFNSWIEGKLFVYVDDIFMSDRMEILETLKPLITEEVVEVQPKGRDKYMTDNRANFILNSNHKDGIRKTVDDRRYAPFYTAQQFRGDLIRDGMDQKYFQNLSTWLRSGGYAITADYLENYPILDKYNPALMSEAPITGSTSEAIASSMGGIEQEIMEAVAQGRVGFMGGWISSVALDRLIEARRDSRKVPNNKRKEMMLTLGYIPHPALLDGRAASMIAIDGMSKPRLYIKRDHMHCQLATNAAIVDAYVKAQEAGGAELAAGLFKSY